MSVDALVAAAIRLAERKRCSVGDISVENIARAAGMSRSTALRRLGGTRETLDDALRKRGIDPSRKPSVRVRAIDAAAEILQEKGLELTMNDIAERAHCSPESLYLTFGNRARLLDEVFQTYSPLPRILEFFAHAEGTFEETVEDFYLQAIDTLHEGPNVVPFFFAHAVSSPQDSAQALTSFGSPKILATLDTWFKQEISQGHIKPLPTIILTQQLMAPFLFNLMLRSGIDGIAPGLLPSPEESARHFAQLFLSAVRA